MYFHKVGAKQGNKSSASLEGERGPDEGSAEDPDPVAVAKAAIAQSDALMKELDADIARVLDQDFPEAQDHNSDKRDPLKQSGRVLFKVDSGF